MMPRMTATLRHFAADDADWLTEQHSTVDAREEGFDSSFGQLVGRILQDFVAQHDPAIERGWIACDGASRLGSIFCVRADDQTAKLRLFLLLPEARGKGLGRQMLQTCMSFAKATGYQRMQLWTHAEHEAACRLYARAGWHLAGSTPVRSFGVNLTEQTWVIDL